MPSVSPFHDVIIAGAGPVGLFLACELRLAGCRVLVLEKTRAPRLPLERPPFGLRGLTTPTCEAFDRRGLLAELEQRAVLRDTPGAHWMRQDRTPGGHFAGIQFFADQVDWQRWPYRTDEPRTLATDMESLKALLARRAEALGVTLRRDCEVSGVIATQHGVSVQAGAAAVAGGWLVGCDGARSVVRKLAGIEFVGTEPEFTGYSALVELADPAALRPGRHYTSAGMYTYAAPGVVAMVDFDGGAFHRTSPVTRDHVETVLRKVSGVDVQVQKLELAATWTDRALQATTYRNGRVLLAGDAAHIHSPLGGQGLNLGLGDAMNLGWKLAATIRGEGAAGLIDSYELERRPIGARLLDWSRAQVALMRPSRSSRALEAMVRDLMETRDGATYFAEQIWGVGQRYDLGLRHPLVGRSAPDFEFLDGSRLNEHLRDARGLLLDFEGRSSLRALADAWEGRIGYLAAGPKRGFGLSAVLVRPDGVVAWASDDEGGEAEAREAAARWFGEPRPPRIPPDRTPAL